ncbi:MAG: YCF48-related protein [Halioglobus sp.]
MPAKDQVGRLLAAVALFCALSGAAPAQEYAPIMPLAARSLLLDIAAAGSRLVVAGEHGTVLFSDDNGDHWQQARVPTIQMLTGICFVDGKHGWTVGHDGLILVSDDGGENWRLQRDGLAVQHQLNLEQREQAHRRVEEIEERLQAADDATRSELETDLEEAQADLENAEETLSEAEFTSPFMDVWFQDANRGWAVGAFGNLVATRDGGQHWLAQERKLHNPDGFHLNSITGDGKGRVFIAGEGGVMFRSLDSGKSWESLEPFYEGSWFGTVYDAAHDSLLVFGLRGNLYRSTDFGTSWDAVVTDNTYTLAGGNASADGQIVLAGGEGTVLLSGDGGNSFTRTVQEDRLSLSSGISHDGRVIVVGQGGVKIGKGATDNE